KGEAGIGERRADLHDHARVARAHAAQCAHRPLHRAEVGDLRRAAELLVRRVGDRREPVAATAVTGLRRIAPHARFNVIIGGRSRPAGPQTARRYPDFRRTPRTRYATVAMLTTM